MQGVQRRDDDGRRVHLEEFAQRRARVAKVVRRGATNYRAWHASGMMARMRNIYLRVHSPERLAARFDWLYGWEPPSLKV